MDAEPPIVRSCSSRWVEDVDELRPDVTLIMMGGAFLTHRACDETWRAHYAARFHELALAPDLAPDLTWAIRESALILVQLAAPMMPHLAEECWQVLGQGGLVSEAAWPQIERDLLVEDTVTMVVQVNGKKRGEVTVGSAAQNPEIEAAVLALDAVKLALGGRAVRKVIVVPKRIVNVVG